jgi:acetolactate synthase-1/2/3 large subunit
VLTEKAGHLPAAVRFAVPAPVVPAATAVAAAAERLAAARAPLIIAGGGALRAAAEVGALAERLGAPLVTTINARGLLPPGHALNVPFSPSLAPVRELVAGADVVLAIGTEFGQTDYDMYGVSEFAQPAGLIRIDIDRDQLQRNVRPELPLLGDATATLQALLAALPLAALRSAEGDAVVNSAGAVRAADARQAAFAALTPAMQRQVAFLEVIRDTVPAALLVGDSTQAVYAGNLGFAAATSGSWFNSATGYGSLGYALPASTGASLAAPHRPVVCLVGDGGLQFSLGELAGPREADAWTAVVIWNNRGYGEIKTSMLAVGIEPEGVDVLPPDFDLLAQAYGYRYRRVDSLATLEQAMRDFAARRQVVVLEVQADAFE